MRALISGITGQDGAYLSKLLLDKGYEVFGIKRPHSRADLSGLKKLGILNRIELVETNVLIPNKISKTLKDLNPSEFYNLSAQSSVGTSFKKPLETFTYNTQSVLNILDAIKEHKLLTKFYQASSSEMFGQVQNTQLPITEDTIFNPVSPYGISKAAAHWMTKNYRDAFGLYCCSGILFNHESALRKNHFVTKKIISTALDIQKGKATNLVLGNTEILRDWGYAPEYVEAMWLMLQQETPSDFLICSGKSHSLYFFADLVFKKLNLNLEDHLNVDPSLFRPNELKEIYGDNTKAKSTLGWSYNKDITQVIEQIIKDELDFQNKGL